MADKGSDLEVDPQDVDNDVFHSNEFPRRRVTITEPEESFTQSAESDAATTDSVNKTSVHVQGLPVYRELVNEQKTAPIWLQFLHRFIPQPIWNSLKPPSNRKEWTKFLFIHLPIVHWVFYYTPRQLVGDIIAGLTIGVTHIPQGIGFALLALLPPVFGLYSSFIPVLLYAIFGTSKHLSVGTFPVVALMTGEVVGSLSFSTCSDNTTMMENFTDSCELSICNTERVNIAITLSLMVGIIMFIMSFLKLGVISLFLSDALISGYTAAAAFTILVTQVSPILGFRSEEAVVEPGLFATPRRLIKYLGLLFRWRVSVAAIVTSIVCFIILIVIDVANRYLKKKVTRISVYIPGQLIVVVLAIIVSYAADISSLPVISDVGGILPGKCYKATLPSASLIDDVLVEAFVIAIVSFVINISQAKLLAQKNAYSIHPDQELFAYGVMNIGGSFFGSFPTAGALSRTVLQDLTGGKTQLVSIISSILVLFVILLLGFLFGPLPNAAISVIVIMALKGLFLQVRDVRRYYYIHWPDMMVWLVIFCATLIIGLDIGLGIGVFFSLFVIVVRTILPYSPGLGEAQKWTFPKGDYHEETEDKDFIVRSIPGLYIYQFNAPLYFANCGVFRSRLFIESGVNPHQFDVQPKGCFEQCYDKFSKDTKGGGVTTPKVSRMFAPQKLEEEEDHDELVLSPIIPDNGATLEEGNNDVDNHSVAVEKLGRDELKELSKPRGSDYYHTIIIDCAPIGFVDSMGVLMIERVVGEFCAVGIQVLLAAPSTPVCEALSRCGFIDRFSSACLFPSVASAVLYAKQGYRVSNIDGQKRVVKRLASNLERMLSMSKRYGICEGRCKCGKAEEEQVPSNIYLETKL